MESKTVNRTHSCEFVKDHWDLVCIALETVVVLLLREDTVVLLYKVASLNYKSL